MNKILEFYTVFLSNPFNAAFLIMFTLAIIVLAFKTRSVFFQAWSFMTFCGAILFVVMINVEKEDVEVVFGPMVIIENGESTAEEIE